MDGNERKGFRGSRGQPFSRDGYRGSSHGGSTYRGSRGPRRPGLMSFGSGRLANHQLNLDSNELALLSGNSSNRQSKYDQLGKLVCGPNARSRGRGQNYSTVHDQSSNEPNQSRKFGFKRLDSLCKLPGLEIMEILTCQKTMTEFIDLTNGPLKKDFIVRIVQILGKLARTEFHEIVVQLIHQISSKSFLDQLLVYIVTYEDVETESHGQVAFDFFDGVSSYCHGVVKLLPTLACERLLPILKQISMVLMSLSFEGIEKIREVTNHSLEKLSMEKDKRKTQPSKRTSAEEALQYNKPPNHFRDLNIIPLADDLLSRDRPFLRPSIIQGPYHDVEHYLDVQFRLLREDFFRPLREGIQEYILKKREGISSTAGKKKRIKVNNIRIYEKVAFQGVQVEEDKVGVCLCFDVDRRYCSQINWEQSKRFMLGSLLILTSNDFESIVLATVLKRSVGDLKEGKILVEIFEEWKGDKVFDQEWQMAESNLFFGAYSHVLEALKKFDEDSLPLKEYIVKAQCEAKMPAYLTQAQNTVLKLPLPSPEIVNESDSNDSDSDEELVISVNAHDTESWPLAEVLGLDESQYRAFKGALTQEVMLIQGPPGTGKTFLGLKVASALLKNSDLWSFHGINPRPLLIVCYTNHALDQFLSGLIPVTQSIVRVGGGSKDKNMDQFSLHNLRRNVRLGPHLYSMLKEFRNIFSELKERFLSIQCAKSSIEANSGIVDPETLFNFGVMSERQIYSFDDRDSFMEWLEGDFPMQLLHKNLGQDVFAQILKNPFIEERELYLIVCFTALNLKMEQSPKDYNYFLQKKMYLHKKLTSPLTKPELLDIQKVNKLRNLKHLQVDQRWQLYRFWVAELIRILNREIIKLQPMLQEASSNLQQAKMVEEQSILSTCKVIGMTTSYASSRQSILKQLRPRIVIVEEAAEVLESHVLVSLTSSVEHLIMIGDHLQLKPNPAVYELATKYHLNVSIFERLINNKVQCVSLTTQHRMCPEIAKLISPSIYPNLLNHDTVLSYPAVKGVTKNVVFIDHNHLQEEVSDIQSFRNVHEAKFIAAFVRYLFLQGYQKSQITVLATYKGQMFYFYKLRQEFPHLEDVRITVVDNYQGEENDIILLSLVRSNDDGDVGFLKVENRVCVALSRAKHGLYIIGNMKNMLFKGEIWPKIKDVLQDQNALVEAIELQCEVHSSKSQIANVDDFKKVPEGGCLLQCSTLLPCGHTCLQVCHAEDREHLLFKCYEPCARPVCPKNHICPDKCFMPCRPCMVPTNVELPCSHSAEVPCHVDFMLYKCLETVMCTLIPCNHERKVLCYQTKDPSQINCVEKCDVRLDCGHSCERNCHLLDDPDHEKYKCRKPCQQKNLGCMENHYCKKSCHQECDNCVVMVEKTLPCGHKWTMKCHEEPSHLLCGNQCQKINACDHKCGKRCKDDCEPCRTKVKKIIPKCGHEENMNCGMNPEDFLYCRNKCNRQLPCGHACTRKCHEPCLSSCEELVAYPKSSACGHTIYVPCSQKKLLDPNCSDLLKRCKEPCNVLLKTCNHKCKGTCGSCWQQRLHQPCHEKCGNVLVCGHSCNAPCAESCPPCNKPCPVTCKHSSCPRRCGEPCTPCLELCSRKCQHQKCALKCSQTCVIRACLEPCKKKLKCNHRCVGFCGDVCICEECHDGIRDPFLGFEDVDEARFVYLPDCKHILESTGLEKWLQEGDEIKEKACPRCSTPIRSCLRYNEIIMRHANDVQKVKRKVFGCERTILSVTSRCIEVLKNVPACLKEFEECWELQKDINNKLSTVKKRKRKGKAWYSPPLSLTEVTNLQQYCQVVESLGNIIKRAFGNPKERGINYELNPKCRAELIKFVENLASLLKKHNLIRMSDQEACDIGNILNRLQCLVQVCLIESSPNHAMLSIESKETLTDLSEKVRGVQQIVKADYLNHEGILKKLADEVKCNITPTEIKAVVAAMGMSRGHWFKCPNGHVYAIGDCGGAMVESKCNECGAKIGGSSHRLLHDNTFAPEMDGASAPAWPGGLY